MQFFKNHKRLTGAGIFGMVLLVFWIVRSNAAAARLERAEALRQQLDSEEAKKLPPEKRKELFMQFGSAMKALSPQQRQVLADKSMQKGQQKIDRFFTLTKQQQLAQLDKDINDMEKNRKQWEQKKKSGGPPQGFAKGPGGPKGPSASPQERERRRKEALNRSTAEERAKRTEYFRMLNARRAQRGLPTMGTKGGGKR